MIVIQLLVELKRRAEAEDVIIGTSTCLLQERQRLKQTWKFLSGSISSNLGAVSCKPSILII